MRFQYVFITLLSGALLIWGSLLAQAATWGANHFPNVPLQTQDGETVRFFDDLIAGKIVAVNFIFTSCVDSCPLETAQLVQVQNILGPRLGRDIHFYSITIDPEIDTPEVLKAYRERFGATWTFLTGEEADIIRLRRKLGLYIEEIQDGSNNHNVSMIIGNQATGRWMKRSPFENPHVLADQLGNWLDEWKAPPSCPSLCRCAATALHPPGRADLPHPLRRLPQPHRPGAGRRPGAGPAGCHPAPREGLAAELAPRPG